jgi:hypothetical protein
MKQSNPDLPVTIPPPSTTRVTSCVSKCRISTAYDNSFTTNGTITKDYLRLYLSSERETGSIINVNQLSTYYLYEIRVYSPPINTYTDQKNMVDSEIVFIHNYRNMSSINDPVTNDIPQTVVFFVPSNIKSSGNDQRDYRISSLRSGTNAYNPFSIKIHDIIPRKSKFYSYNSIIPIKNSNARYIECLSLIFNITPIAVLGISENIISKFKNTINIDAIKMCPSGSNCNVTTMNYAPMGLNPNTNKYYLSCGDVTPQQPKNTSSSSSSELFKKYNISIDTVYTLFSILVGGFLFIIILWVVGGIIIGLFFNSGSENHKS